MNGFPKLLLLAAACCLPLWGPWFLRRATGDSPSEKSTVATALRGHLLRVAGDDNGGVPLAPAGPETDVALEGRRFVALYFSANWCPPCHVFTPKLVNFYRAARAAHPEFEVVFVSQDHSDEEMRTYLQESGMPFPAVRFADLREAAPALANLGGEYLPALVLVDARGRLLADPYQNGKYVGPERVLVELQRRLTATAASTPTDGDRR